MSLLTLAFALSMQGQDAAKPADAELPPVANAGAAIEGGIEHFCRWFVRGEGYSLDRAREVAAEAGFRRGASVSMIPLAEMTQLPAYSSLGFTARLPAGMPEDEGVAAFITFHIPVCQLLVYGQASEAARYVGSLASRGWTSIGRLDGADVTSERWLHGSGADAYTLVVNRWTNSSRPAPAKLGYILVVLSGNNRTNMGTFQ